MRWLTAATRYAGMPRPQARLALALLAILLVVSLGATATWRSAPDAAAPVADAQFYEGVVDGVRHGGDYYTIAADASRIGGLPLRPFLALRIPTLAMVEAWIGPVASALLLYFLAIGALWAWYARLGGVLAGGGRVIAVVLLAAGMLGAVRAELIAVHELWAGLLIALSLAVRRPERWIECVALGLAATLISEAAALYLAIMAAAAMIERARREAIGWLTAAATFAIALACHAHAVAQITRPLDRAMAGVNALSGPGFALQELSSATALAFVPGWLGGALVALAVIGWSGWREPLATRVFAILVAVLVLLSIVARPGTSLPLLVAPLIPLGIAFAIYGTRDLVRAALDTRRITVTRIVR